MNKYTRLFIDETRQYLDVIARCLDDAARAGDELADSCRLAHSIKGMALFEEQDAIADLAYALERGLAHAADAGGKDASLLEDLAEGAVTLGRMIDEVDLRGTPGGEGLDLVEKIEGRIDSP